ncbi:BQ5605_C001g00701 [Microbotryum silenes-dioicae]|uniref:BQ5605_C001g00701 protein n=1 Tax=Microbotryum silenes-dioicae TaxID=796604 RepID=A0A2X0P0N0_9BASI|nr:BQ5605_C001g00701 [Microbotryum silenes-dioicae]
MESITSQAQQHLSLDLTKVNISLYAIPLAYILALLPHVYMEIAMILTVGKWSNASPRGNVDAASARLPAHKLAQFKRGRRETLNNVIRHLDVHTASSIAASAAHTNGLENLSLFVGAILSANWASVSTEKLNQIAVLYVVLRLIYNPVYIFGNSKIVSLLRSTIWFGAQGMTRISSPSGSSLYLLKLAADQTSGIDSTRAATTFLAPPALVVLLILGARIGK